MLIIEEQIKNNKSLKEKKMRKFYANIVTISIVVFLLAGCENKTAIVKDGDIDYDTSNETISSYVEEVSDVNDTESYASPMEDFLYGDAENITGTYASVVEKEFYNIIVDNPIDNDPALKNTEIGGIIRIEFAVKYRDAWKAEIENTLVILEQYL
jgi:uncharacterized lipoprotein NlpE involved in copper resistance